MKLQSNTVAKFQSQKTGYRKLILWQKGIVFLKQLYKKTELFPRSEIFGLQSQIRRATISFLLNIIEGQRRTSTKDFLKFLNTAEASLVEVEACLEIANELTFLQENDYVQLESQREELAIMLQAFIRSIKKSL